MPRPNTFFPEVRGGSARRPDGLLGPGSPRLPVGRHLGRRRQDGKLINGLKRAQDTFLEAYPEVVEEIFHAIKERKDRD